MIDPQHALIYTMVLASASDRNVTDAELAEIGEQVRYLRVFKGFDRAHLDRTAAECIDLLAAEDGLDRTLATIRDALPERLYETAYALACDVVAADGRASQEELRLLEMIRDRLDIDRLSAAAIERGARARHAPL